MKLKELYSVMALIFAANFKEPVTKENFKKINENWIIKNETDENKKGHEYLKKAKNSNYNEIKFDFENLKESFEMDYYKLIDETSVTLFFEKTRFVKPFTNYNSSHSSNMLAFLSSIFKHDNDEKTHALLGKYLTDYLIFSLRALAKNLQINAKSDYYKAFGWFLQDYCNMIKISLGLKA